MFLVNTVALVDQHSNNLKRHTPFKVGAYSGDMNVDYWSKEKWNEEFSKYQIFVMTTQIFLNIIVSSFLSNIICLLHYIKYLHKISFRFGRCKSDYF